MTPTPTPPPASSVRGDLTAAVVVFLVALPLCLGVALASGAPLISGIVAGVVGGILVGLLSGSNTSVSGPAAGLTAVVAAQIVSLGSFEVFLLAVVVAGLMQIGLGLARAGTLGAFIPSSVIKGLLAAIGVLLILKQIPHLLGHDADPEGDMAFAQPDQQNTFTELFDLFGDAHLGAAAIGLLSVALLVVWGRWKRLKSSPVPAPLAVVLLGVGLVELFRHLGGPWAVDPGHLVQVPVAADASGFFALFASPDFTHWSNPAVYKSAATLAAVASLETLLNLEAVDKLDPQRRVSPPSRELVAQGIGNVASGLCGGIPVTSVIVRSSVNINAGGKSKLVTVAHGVLLLVCVAFLPALLNRIPLSCLAAILLVTGFKLITPALVKQMWNDGRYQFAPFALTVVAIVFTDLLVGVLLGIAASLGFILWSNVRRPLKQVVEKRPGGDVLHIELGNQVSFLNRVALAKAFHQVPQNGHVLLDARRTDYIDPDVYALIREFKDTTGPARAVEVSLLGFQDDYHLRDRTHYAEYSTRELQASLTPGQVLQVLKNGHERFLKGQHLTRDLSRQVSATAAGQHPLAVVLSCIDSRAPVELIFDVGLGDIFTVRIAGNVTGLKVIGSVEYACAVAGAKLVLVMGHTRCGAVTAAVELFGSVATVAEATGCQHLDEIVGVVQDSIDESARLSLSGQSPGEKEAFVNAVARRNVERAVERLLRESDALAKLVRDGRLAVVGAMYDVVTGDIEFLGDAA